MQSLTNENVQISNVLFANKIESVQYNAALAITGCIRGTSKEKLYNELDIESLYDRRTFHRLLYLRKIKKNLLPVYLKHEIPPSAPNLHDTRHYRSTWISTRTININIASSPIVCMFGTTSVVSSKFPHQSIYSRNVIWTFFVLMPTLFSQFITLSV